MKRAMDGKEGFAICGEKSHIDAMLPEVDKGVHHLGRRTKNCVRLAQGTVVHKTARITDRCVVRCANKIPNLQYANPNCRNGYGGAVD